MLGDISNHCSSPATASKRSLATVESQTLGLQKQFPVASSSSSPSNLNWSSSPFFATTRLDAYHASSSPAPANKLLSTPTKRANLLASLPPSSPSFALSSSADFEQLDVVSEEDPATVQQEDSVNIRLEGGTVLYFGRKAKKAIPRTRSPGYNPTEQSVPILLPKSAKNASRIHCSARIVKSKKSEAVAANKFTVEVRVTGQNGMKIDGKLWKAGSLARLTVESGRELELSFWGWDANVTVVGTNKRSTKRDEATGLKRSTPASSSLDSLSEDDGEIEQRGPPKRSRMASPALSTTSLSSLASPPALSFAATRARSLASSTSLDLPGLLASAIVFHPRSTVGVDELVRALLKESGPQLWQVLSDDREEVEKLKETPRGEAEAVRAWTPVCQEVLREERMFGMIDNTGLKDAAGRPLPPYYYYVPDLDSSRSRVEALEPFVKRVRGARTSKPIRYFWAKPK
ncbi:hypothetical protein JCM16303_001535 [Sporobolomyces ruberrimus]